MEKYRIPYLVSSFIRKRSFELRKLKCYSVWYYNEPERSIVICTTRPGLWIGYYGKDLDELRNGINEKLALYKMEPVTIKLIECYS